jgi:mannose-6-phosphate isomerase-like protein (cupin superfamily)
MKTVKLKATGELMRFVRTSADTNGEAIEVIIEQPAEQQGPPAHRHTLQTEYFEVLKGNAIIESGHKKIHLKTGESFTVPENTFHTYASADKQPLTLRVILSPALDMEYFLVETYASSNKHNSENPSFMDNCYLIAQMRGQYYVKSVPELIQKTLYPLLAKAAGLFGLVSIRPKLKFKGV